MRSSPAAQRRCRLARNCERSLSEAFPDHTGAHNTNGERQAGLDLYADDPLLEAAGRAPVAIYASEERPHPVILDPSAPPILATDPPDGSSNIDVNVSIGTIFSMLSPCPAIRTATRFPACCSPAAHNWRPALHLRPATGSEKDADAGRGHAPVHPRRRAALRDVQFTPEPRR
ncbi:MAG: hypothetical protein IPK28_18730 [Devosia sp.]|nr:hypothetical protein [Devosia sp.]